MTNVETIVRMLERAGVRWVFGIPSGPVLPLIEALGRSPVEFVLTANETSAGFMATTVGQLTGVPGACAATVGPGATNLTTGVGCAWLDCAPALAITCNVPSPWLQRRIQMRIDHNALFRPLTKATFALRADDVGERMAEALALATAELPGPVHLDLPEDVGTASSAAEAPAPVVSPALADVADEARGALRDYVWSPRGGHLAFSMTDPTEFSSIWVWSLADRELHRITDDLFHEWNPAWDPDGDFLYYLSDRQFAPQLGSFEWNYLVDRETGIYALALRKDVPHPLPPESDEVELAEEDDEGAGGDGSADDGGSGDGGDDADEGGDGEGPIGIDFEGLSRRVVRLPVTFDNYVGLSGADDGVFFIRGGAQYYGRGGDVRPALQRFTFEDRETKTIADGIGGYAVSRDGEKVLVREGSTWNVYPAGGGDATSVSTRGLMVDRVPAEEWAQIFDEVWRRFRDFFYVENMHGYDWEALRDRYRPLLEHVAHRSDLNYVIGEMVAELSVSHAYIAGGDWETPARPPVALPGAVFELDAAAGRYRLAEIFAGHNEEPRYRAPLTEIGVDARVGDYVLAIDGEELAGSDNPYRVLRHRADRPVRLTLNTEPTFDGAREVTFTPRTEERSLRYLTEVEANRRRVSEMTDGRVGYLHVPDMGAQGIQEFVKWFYGQIRKEGLVIDVRGNGGGNVSQMLIERLGRRVLGTRFARTYDTPGTYPDIAFHGHMVCILDEDSASDGDIFPYRFREAGLGPLIGKRSWGGVIGITNHGPLIDGGSVNVPQFGTNGADGSWVVENVGVEPDIEVDNDPRSVIAGQDPQLERAVEEVLRMMRENPKALPERPAPPVKTP